MTKSKSRSFKKSARSPAQRLARAKELVRDGQGAAALALLEGLDEGVQDRWLLRGLRCQALVASGDLDAAEKLLGAGSAAPEAMHAMGMLGVARVNAGEGAAGRQWLERVAANAPGRPDLIAALAIARAASGDAVGTAQAWADLTRLGATRAAVALEIARAFRTLGIDDQGREWMRRAAELSVTDVMGFAQIGVEARLMGYAALAVEILERARSSVSGEPLLDLEYAVALQRAGQDQTALPLLEAVVAARPELPEAYFHLAECLQSLGQREAARAALQGALRLAPEMVAAEGNLGIVELELEHYDAALTQFRKHIDRLPLPTRALALSAVALDGVGRDEEAARVVDLERYRRLVRLADAQPELDVVAFNARLADHLLQHPSLKDSPAQHATRGGLHSGEILADRNAEIDTLKDWLVREIVAYAEALEARGPDPFLSYAPTPWTLTGWCVVLREGGHQIPHIHTSAWLSGVYYVQLPPAVAADSADREGWLEFGIPDRFCHFTAATRLHPVLPEPGLLVLFPSYFYHRTVPVSVPGEARVSIAFDVIPA